MRYTRNDMYDLLLLVTNNVWCLCDAVAILLLHDKLAAAGANERREQCPLRVVDCLSLARPTPRTNFVLRCIAGDGPTNGRIV